MPPRVPPHCPEVLNRLRVISGEIPEPLTVTVTRVTSLADRAWAETPRLASPTATLVSPPQAIARASATTDRTRLSGWRETLLCNCDIQDLQEGFDEFQGLVT